MVELLPFGKYHGKSVEQIVLQDYKYFDWLKKNGVESRTEPKTWPWGKREFVVKDPDGYKLVFYSPVKK